jgi:NAD(P)-dependent dehydrogenase (short-subunit alcohol dehydrogenase family)
MWQQTRFRTLKAMAHNGSTTPTALITGASRGLGLALARSLAADGWRLIIDARDPAALEAAAAELRRHTEVVALAGDVASEEHRMALAEAAAAAGGLDVAVHNASLLGPSPQPALAAYPLEKLREVYSVNVFAPLRLTQVLLPYLRPGARLVFVTSDASVEAYEGWGGYGSSKAALDQIAAVLGAEQPSLRVYAVDPGDMNTRMHQEAFRARTSPTGPRPKPASPACGRSSPATCRRGATKPATCRWG